MARHRTESTRRALRINRRRNTHDLDGPARELATLRFQAELAELAAVLDRHGDAESEPIRAIVDWTRAA